jgi:hypothetical protein
MVSLIVLKTFILSILTALGLISGPEREENLFQEKAHENQLSELNMESSKSQNEIVDVNPVSDTEIRPEDLDRTKMLSAQFCGPLQAQLFEGIIEANSKKIDDAIARGADVNKPSNCWRPLDEAIEQEINSEHDFIVVHLLGKGAIVSIEQIERLRNKILVLATNITADPQKMEITLGPVQSAPQQAKQIAVINTGLIRKQKRCEKISQLLQIQLHRQLREKLTAQAQAAASRPDGSAPAAKSTNFE